MGCPATRSTRSRPRLLADALAGVHEAGYRHGEVKPSATNSVRFLNLQRLIQIEGRVRQPRRAAPDHALGAGHSWPRVPVVRRVS